MIDYKSLKIDTSSKRGVLQDLGEAWTTRVPFVGYTNKVGAYTVPSGYNTKIKGLMAIADDENIALPRLGANSLVFTVLFQVNGVNKMEFRVPAFAADFNTVMRNDFNFNDRFIRLFDGLQFVNGDVIRLVTTQPASAGLVPQIHWDATFLGKDTTTGDDNIQKAETIITVSTATQVIITYTVPANGFTLRNIFVQASTGDFYKGFMAVLVNGQLVLELPMQTSGYRTTAGKHFRGFIPFFDGLNLAHGSTIEYLCNPIEALNQKFGGYTFGNEIQEAVGSGGEISHVF